MREFSLESYDYALDPKLIAKYPATPKESAKLLVYERASGRITHSTFANLFDFIPQDYLLVFNDTKVIKARIYGRRASGGGIEILLHKRIESEGANSREYGGGGGDGANSGGSGECKGEGESCGARFLVQIRGKVKVGEVIYLESPFSARVVEMLENGYRVVEFFEGERGLFEVFGMLDSIGHVPLPPYIRRADEALDMKEYQSVFAKNYGAIAAPTASLHFSDAMFDFATKHYENLFLTLHVGAGTFVGVESEDIRAHQIHSEMLLASKEAICQIQKSQKLLCVGTTAMRSVEFLARLGGGEGAKTSEAKNHSAGEILCKGGHEMGGEARGGILEKTSEGGYCGECDIFLHLGNPPIKTTALLTNFHLPKSTLIMLVASLVGLDTCMELYREAMARGYRFYSYGDGMLIL